MRLDVIAIGVEGTQFSSRLRSESWRESTSICSKRADAQNLVSAHPRFPYQIKADVSAQSTHYSVAQSTPTGMGRQRSRASDHGNDCERECIQFLGLVPRSDQLCFHQSQYATQQPPWKTSAFWGILCIDGCQSPWAPSPPMCHVGRHNHPHLRTTFPGSKVVWWGFPHLVLDLFLAERP